MKVQGGRRTVSNGMFRAGAVVLSVGFLNAATLEWDANSEPEVSGYRVYYGNASRGYTNVVDVGNTTSWPISGLVDRVEYFFAVTAYTVDGLESDFSEEVSYTPGATQPTNHPPIISVVPDQAIEWNNTTATIPLVVGDAETSSSNLVLSADSSNHALVPVGNIVVGGSGSNRTVRVSPAPDAYGSATIVLTVSDGELSASSSFQVAVMRPNTAPTISAINDQSAVTGQLVGPLAFTVADAETGAGNLILTATSQNQAVVPNGAIVIGGSGSNRTLSFSIESNGVTQLTLTVSDGVLSAATTFTVTAQLAPAPSIVAFTNSNRINVPEMGSAFPYPSELRVAGVETGVASVTLTLHGLTHQRPDDLDVLLVSPSGKAVLAFSDVGGNTGVSGVTIDITDFATGVIPDQIALVSGSYKPSNSGMRDDFPAPAPSGPYETALGVSAGEVPDGTWKLYVMDDGRRNDGWIEGWSLTFHTEPAAAARARAALIANGEATTGESFTLSAEIAGYDENGCAIVHLTGTVAGTEYLLESSFDGGATWTTVGVVTADGAEMWAVDCQSPTVPTGSLIYRLAFG